jgi:hypothetical protein
MHCNRHTKISTTLSLIGSHPKRDSGYGKLNADLAFLMVSSARGQTYHSPPVKVALPHEIRERLYFARNTRSRITRAVWGTTQIYIKLMHLSVKDVGFGTNFIFLLHVFVDLELSLALWN